MAKITRKEFLRGMFSKMPLKTHAAGPEEAGLESAIPMPPELASLLRMEADASSNAPLDETRLAEAGQALIQALREEGDAHGNTAAH